MKYCQGCISKKRILTDKDGNIVIDTDGNPVTYSDVELFYGNPNNPQKLPHDFWWDFETSLDKIDDQEINYFFGRDGVKNIQMCANNAQRILREIFCDWVTSIEITEEEPNYDFGENVLFINFNYTDTLLKRFGVKEINEYHVHGSAVDKNSIIVGHSTHPELPYESLRMWKDKPRLQGLYYIEEFLYNADKHVEDNYMKLCIFCALHGVRIEDIKKIYVLGLGFGNADLGYIKHLIHTTEGICENPESDLEAEELAYLNNMDFETEEGLVKPFLEDSYYHIARDDQMRLEYLTPEEAFLKADEETIQKLNGVEWHISYFSNGEM